MSRRSAPAPGAADGGPDVDDDEPVGRILSRREVLRLFGGGGAVLALAACVPTVVESPVTATPAGVTLPTATPASAAVILPTATPAAEPFACVVRPAMTEGPYFVDQQLNRSDIRANSSDGIARDGVPLQLTFRVQQIDGNGCVPLSSVQVDIWHCDADGVYSGSRDPGFNTVGQDFLRGFQMTDANGLATFATIYPGWYSGRTVHIHYKVRTDPAASVGYEFTSQLFFDDNLTDQVFVDPLYASRGARNTRNSNDNIFRGGDQTVLSLTSANAGYSTIFDIALDFSA